MPHPPLHPLPKWRGRYYIPLPRRERVRERGLYLKTPLYVDACIYA